MEWILYGATGITGRLITQTAVRRGHRPILAGRNAEALRRLAEPDGLTWRTADLDDEDAVKEFVAAAPLILLASSTFNTASLRLARASLAAGTHYLDLANEVPVLEAVYGLDDEAQARGVTLLPSVGFGTVAADTLARYLVDQLPDAEVLDLTIDLYTAGTSRGRSPIPFASSASVHRSVVAGSWSGCGSAPGLLAQLCRPGHVRSSRFPAASYPRCIARPGCRTSACRDQLRCLRLSPVRYFPCSLWLRGATSFNPGPRSAVPRVFRRQILPDGAACLGGLPTRRANRSALSWKPVRVTPSAPSQR